MYIDEQLLKILEIHKGETADVNFIISLIKSIAKEYETEQLRIGGASQCNELVCDCTPISTQVSQINGRYICCNCNKPLLSQTCG